MDWDDIFKELGKKNANQEHYIQKSYPSKMKKLRLSKINKS